MRLPLGALVLVWLLVQGCSGGTVTPSAGGGKKLASVNGKEITEGDIDFLATINPRIKAQTSSIFGKKQIVDNLIEQELLYQESARRGLEHDPKVTAKTDLYRRVIIAQAALDDEMEKSARKYYGEHKEEFDKLELSHILIRTKSEKPDKDKGPQAQLPTHPDAQALALAGQIKARLDQSEDFAKVAKEVSEDPGSKNAGGLLGKVWKQDPRLERRGYGPLLEKAFAMKVGEVAGPIKTEEGYHLITVTKGVESQSFDDAKPQIFFKMQSDTRNKFVADLKQKAQVEYAEELQEKKPEEKPSENKPAVDGAQPTPEAPAGGQIVPVAPPAPTPPAPPAATK